MSFSGKVKEELRNAISTSRHCQIAEISAIIEFCGSFKKNDRGELIIRVQTENAAVARKYFTLLKKTFNIYSSVLVRQNMKQSKSLIYVIDIEKPREVQPVLQALKIMKQGVIAIPEVLVTDDLLIKNSCCRRTFLRGAYLCVGSMSDPEKSYHLEFVCMSQKQARQLTNTLNEFMLDAKIVLRKKYYVVYIKEGSHIVDLLNIMEAHVALMELENLRILKEMRNSINRRVNCEAANITKTVNAASKQSEDIIYIRDHYGFGNLPSNLWEIAEVRLENQEASLKELGEMLDPPVGKSGVNHRLRKLSELADRLRM